MPGDFEFYTGCSLDEERAAYDDQQNEEDENDSGRSETKTRTTKSTSE